MIASRQRPAVAPSTLVSALLAEYGAITLEALRGYLPRTEPRHYLYDLVADYPQRGGEMLRPSLLIATARAFGASTEDALCSAIVGELLHNAMLIHRDIEFGSEQRQGRPTLHLLHGLPLALNAGDATTLLSLRPLIENSRRLGPRLAWRVIVETDRTARESAEGQAIELGWIRDNTTDLDDADYLRMILKQSCWAATIAPSRVGALIGTRGAVDPDSFVRFGFFLGAAFQIRNDLLNLSDREGQLAGGIREGRRTLMLIRLLQQAAPEDRARLTALLELGCGRWTAEQVRWVLARMEAYGCLDYAREIARGLGGAALHEHALLFAGLSDSRDKQFLEELAVWVIEGS